MASSVQILQLNSFGEMHFKQAVNVFEHMEIYLEGKKVLLE